MIEINLLPGGARRRKDGAERFDVKTMFAGLSSRVSDKYLVGAVAAVVVGVVAIATMFITQRNKATHLAERERRALQDSSKFAMVLKAKADAEAERDAVLLRLAIIRSIDDNRYVWPHLLEEISRNLPAFTWLTAIVQTSAPPSAAIVDSNVTALRQKGDTTSPTGRARIERARRDAAIAAAIRSTRFRITGNTVDIQALTRFMRDLEASPFIRNVQLARSDLVIVDTKEVTEFQLDAESEPPAPSDVVLVPLQVSTD